MARKTIPKLKDFIDIGRFDRRDIDRMENALEYASRAHEDQLRLSGEPFITHPIHVARMLFEMGFDSDVIIAGLLHDTVEDTGTTLEHLGKEFGSEVADLVFHALARR